MNKRIFGYLFFQVTSWFLIGAPLINAVSVFALPLFFAYLSFSCLVLYISVGKPLISEYEYDKLKAELKESEKLLNNEFKKLNKRK